MKTYLKSLRRDRSWGDHLEIQAMSELYNFPVAIYEYGEPIKKFHESKENLPNILLSYHSKNHYNAVLSAFKIPFLTSKPGKLESERIELAKSILNDNDIRDVKL